MVALWVVYCLGISALLAAAAAASERFLSSRGLPIRWTWTCAILGSLALPAWSLVEANASETTPYDQRGVAAEAVSQKAETGAVVVRRSDPRRTQPAEKSLSTRTLASATRLLHAASPFVSALWLISSLSMGIVLFGGWLRIRRKRALWRRMLVGGRPIMISRRTGPAVVGFIRPAIVLPAWALELGEVRRELVLLHEEEHLRAHDERLLLLAGIALIPMPWNVGMWYQVRRLRLAVEIDCDARVLRRHPDAREYADLLLDVGRRVNSGALQMAALSEPVSFLAMRVSAMVTVRKQSRAAASITLALATGAIAIACQAPRPPAPRLLSDQSTGSPLATSLTSRHEAPDSTVVWDGERMTRDSLVRRIWGKTLAATAPATLEFVVDANDVVVSAGVSNKYEADSSGISHRLPDGYGSVTSAKVASIDVERSNMQFPAIARVIWIRLKKGVDFERQEARPGDVRAMTGSSAEYRRLAAMTETSADYRRLAGTTAPARSMVRQREITATGGTVDPDYQLGPGDRLVLTLTGDVEQSHELEVTREGFIVIPQVGQVFVNNLRLAQLEDVLYSRLGRVYSGVRRGPGATTRFSITASRLRGNQIFGRGQPATSQAESAITQERLARDLALQLQRHEREAATLEAEMARHATEAAALRARLRAAEAALANRNRASAAAYGGARRRPAARSAEFPSDSTLRAAARKLYPNLVNNPPESPVTLWFLADTIDQVLQTRLVHSRLGTVGMREVLGAFPNLIEERVRSWTVTALPPFAIVWVRVTP